MAAFCSPHTLARCRIKPTTLAQIRMVMEKRVEAINVKYIYSACVITTTPDLSILHDPWFTEGAYDGSWFHFPKVENPLKSIGDVDIIFISHIHPDHYDNVFLKKYFEKYGIKKILIANHSPNHLAGKMRADGIEPTILKDKLTIGDTTVEIVPHKTGSISDIDSAIVIKYHAKNNKQHCVVNANDIIFDEDMRSNLKSVANEVDILLCGYTGAGPYPQTYFNSSDNQLNVEANNKKLAFFERYKTLVKVMGAKVNIPFAGKYILGGKLSDMNDYRGVADPVEVLEFDEKAVVLADNGGEINTSNLIPNHIRTNKYDAREKTKRIEEIKTMRMDYERLIAAEEIGQLPLKRLLFSASRNAVIKSECDEDYYFCIKLPNEQVAVINANKNESNSLVFAEKCTPLPTPRSEIFIDPRYLFGLLTKIYHWDNAEVGSQFDTRRTPNTLNRKAQAFLNYLAI
jgi:UDP-MurNAc hydroxylase